MDIKTLLRGGKVQQIECYGMVFSVKSEEGISMENFSKVAAALETLDKYVDISNIGTEEEFVEEWVEKELREFMDGNNDTQTAMFKILLDGEIKREDLVKRLGMELNRKATGWTLGGALAGANNRIRNAWKREDLVETEWKRVNHDWKCYYWIKPKYQDMIKNYFEEQD